MFFALNLFANSYERVSSSQIPALLILCSYYFKNVLCLTGHRRAPSISDEMSLPDADDTKYDVSASDDQGVDLSQTCEVSQASEISSVTGLTTAVDQTAISEDQRTTAVGEDTDDDEDSEIFETEKLQATPSALTSSLTADNEYTSIDVGTAVTAEGGLSTSNSNEALSSAAVGSISELEQAYPANCDIDDIYKQSSADPVDAALPSDAGSVAARLRLGDIGELADLGEIPAVYLVRLLCSEFLLTGYPCVLMPDQCVRVSVKTLALMCVASLVDLCPRAFIVKLHRTSSEPGNSLSGYWNNLDCETSAV